MGPFKPPTPPKHDPDRAGDVAKGWHITAKNKTALDAWLIHHPTSHPFWSYYLVSLIHLRDVPGVPPANKQFDAATHEILFLTLDPENPLPDPRKWTDPKFLTPPDLAAQFEVNNDTEAQAVFEAVLDTIIKRGYPLDSDHRSWWETSIRATAGHERTGEHR